MHAFRRARISDLCHRASKTSSERHCTSIGAAATTNSILARYFRTSTAVTSGAIADVCNLNIQTSPFPPIIDSSEFTPVPEFVSAEWKNPKFADKVTISNFIY